MRRGLSRTNTTPMTFRTLVHRGPHLHQLRARCGLLERINTMQLPLLLTKAKAIAVEYLCIIHKARICDLVLLLNCFELSSMFTMWHALLDVA